MNKHYWQLDPMWKNVLLGTSRATIGREGCLLCAVAGALEIIPPVLNRWLARHNGFVDDNLFVFDSVEPLGLKLEKIIDCQHIPAPVDEIAEFAADPDSVVLLQVSTCPPYLCEHWVRVFYFEPLPEETDVLIFDPLLPSGPTWLLPHYAKPDWDLSRAIFRAALYKRVEK